MQKKTYIVNHEFILGATGTRLYRGVELEFDGVYAIVDGQRIAAPALKATIQRGWLVEADSYDEDDDAPLPPPQAPILMGPSKHSGNDSISLRKRVPVASNGDDAREVMEVAQHSAQTKARNANRQGPSRDPKNTARLVRPGAGDYATADDGTVVRQLQTPTKTAPKIEPGSIQREIAIAERGVQIEAIEQAPGKRMPLVSGDEDPRYAAPDYSGSKKSKKSRKVESEGITFTLEGAETIEPLAPSKPASVASVQPISTAEAGMRLRMAKSFCQDFPDNYSFGAPAKKKLARIEADFAEERPDVVRAIWMAETDEFKRVLEQQFPSVFQE